MDTPPATNQRLNDPRATARRGPVGVILIGAIRVYQAVGSPFFGRHCRFQPTCSHYAVEAIEQHGSLRGSWLTVRRLLRCHPFGAAGWDPVPCRHDPDHAEEATP